MMRSDGKIRTSGSKEVDTLDLNRAERLRAIPAIVVGAVVGSAVGGVVAKLLAVASPTGQLLLLAAGAVLGGYAALRTVTAIVRGVALSLASVVLPRGRTTPPVDDYSLEDALLMQRDVRGALASLEAKIAGDPALVGARLRAADLFLGEGNDPARAEVLLRAVQRIPGVTHRDDAYASSRLVDLYDARGDTGRAVVELRRLAERYPGTRTAEDALRGLTTLKARLHEERERADA
jgi:hypothetical protein